MLWDTIYKGNNRIWGEEPSELAVFAVYYLKTLGLNDKNLSILDVGCGYGRDAVYFSKHLRCTVLGIDSSKEAIDMAKTACSKASNIDKVYLHFCTRNELGNEFNFLKIKELYEHEYYEPHTTGEVHHRISWILIGESAGISYNLQ